MIYIQYFISYNNPYTQSSRIVSDEILPGRPGTEQILANHDLADRQHSSYVYFTADLIGIQALVGHVTFTDEKRLAFAPRFYYRRDAENYERMKDEG